MYTIGEVAKRTGLTTSTLRFYEEIGLLTAPPRISKQRRYDDSIFEQIHLIQLAQKLGFTLAEIAQIQHANVQPSALWQQFAIPKMQELDQLIQTAQQMKTHLEKTLSCQCQHLTECLQANL